MRFRRLGLACAVHANGMVLVGKTLHLGVPEVGVLLDAAPLPGVLSPGDSVQFRVLHSEPGSKAATASAEVLFLHPSEGGHELGLRITTGAEQLARFVESFRFRVVLALPADVPDAPFLEALRNFEVVRASTASEALDLVSQAEMGVLICDSELPGMPLAGFLERAREIRSRLNVVVVTHAAHVADEVLPHVDVFHFLRAPFRPSELQQVTQRAAESHALEEDTRRLTNDLARVHRRLSRENIFLRRRAESTGFDHLIGRSPPWRRALEELACAIGVDTPLHLTGETGTGKEVVARAVHLAGARRNAPFIAYNCAGIPEALAISIFFGHRRGAFTGADRDQPGLFELANGGTLFLDEVAELPLAVQPALLRALQEKQLTPLGATQPISFDLRVLTATHKRLAEEVRAGRFREDLYFRLVVLTCELPTLRERREDIALLARHFLALQSERIGRPTPELAPRILAALEAYPWPGNVRELENEMERLAILSNADQGELDPSLLTPAVRGAAPLAGSGDTLSIDPDAGLDAAVERLQTALIERAMRAAQGNTTVAASLLAVERSRLSKLKTRLQQT